MIGDDTRGLYQRAYITLNFFLEGTKVKTGKRQGQAATAARNHQDRRTALEEALSSVLVKDQSIWYHAR